MKNPSEVRRRPWLRTGAALMCAVIIGVGVIASDADARRRAQPSFFGSTETRSKNMKPFKKWTGALARFSAEKAKEEQGSCESTAFNYCHYQEWQKFLKGLEGKDKWDQILSVNRFMNSRRYITDPRNWGKKDYWATPIEFMKRFGDCEDYSISKYASLKQLGFTDDEMRLAAVKDLNLKVGHAILIVWHGGKTWLLDNQIKRVVETETVRHYKPVFSINETAWWRHRAKKG